MRRTLPVLLCVLAATGCTASSSSHPSQVSPGPPAERLMLTALDRGDVDLTDAFAYWADRNARIARCIQPAGYAYRSFVSRSAIDRRRALGLSRMAFTERYGYGTTTLIDYVPPGTTVVDPNEFALDKMAPADRRRIAARLDDCVRAADTAAGPAPYATSQHLDPAQAARSDQILARVDADARIAAAQRIRTDCIRAAGYDPGDRRTLPYAKAAEPARDRFETAAAQLAAAGRDSTHLRLAKVLPTDQMAALATLQRREITEARRVQPCQFEYDDIYRAVYRQTLNDALNGAF